MEKLGFNHVRTFRQRHGLTERDLARLINRSPGYVSLLEYGDTSPAVEVALALQVLFRQQPKHLFPDLYDRVEDAVMRRAARLHERIGDQTDRRSTAKRDFVDGLAATDNETGP